jgi:spermidine synthase
VKPLKTIATAENWILRQRGDEYLVQRDGRMLLTSKRHGSEDLLAYVGCARLDAGETAKVLVGGLGFGFTLRATLAAMPRRAKVVVNEPSKALATWNQELVGHLTNNPLLDERVTLEVGTLRKTLNTHQGEFDAIIMDVDDAAFAVSMNETLGLYSVAGLSSLRLGLRKGGRLAIWSPGPQSGFVNRLKEVGLTPSVQKPEEGKHLIFVGDL